MASSSLPDLDAGGGGDLERTTTLDGSMVFLCGRYELDQDAGVARVIWQFAPPSNPAHQSGHAGSVYDLPRCCLDTPAL